MSVLQEKKAKTLYLWDLGNTLFPEKWNKEKTGFETYGDYVVSLGVDVNDDYAYSLAEKEAYLDGEMYGLGIAEGYREVLIWTKENEAFTRSVHEAMDWRAEYLNPKVGFDIRKYLPKVVTTFDYANVRHKTPEIIAKYLEDKIKQDYTMIVYTDDNLDNCVVFKKELEKLNREKATNLECRFYHLLNDKNGIRKKDWYFEIGSLWDLMENEKKVI